ncbi:MAG TPA: transcriptional regulator [Oceanospirillaceae bacterium]|nr:transcriptional regulator [Oceanospirillaceae bacterium]
MTVKLGDALFSKTQQNVLGLLYGKPDRRFYANEIVRFANMGRGTVRRELEKLTLAKILTSTKEGNQLYYQANQDNPIYTEVLGIVRKTFGIADVIRDALDPLDDCIELAFVYGSLAKSSDHRASDIDLLLVASELGYGDLMMLLAPVEATLQRPINPTIYSPDQLSNKLQAENSFVMRVMEQPKLMIKGVINDFREPTQEQKPT